MKALTEHGLKVLPDSAFDLYFAGRARQLAGDNDEAIALFDKSIAVQNQFPAIHAVAKWDQLWCYAMNCEWSKAADIASVLQNKSQWSPATNAYQYACFTYMIMEEENRPELSVVVDEAMASVEKLRMRFAGKTIPP